MALVDTGASRHVVGKFNSKVMDFIGKVNTENPVIFSQIDSRKLTSAGAAEIGMRLSAVMAGSVGEGTDVDICPEVELLGGTAATQMLVLSAGKIMYDHRLRIVVKERRRTGADGTVWYEYHPFLTNGASAIPMRIHSNNLFYVRIELKAKGEFDAAAVAQSVVDAASEMASVAAGPAVDAIRVLTETVYSGARRNSSGRRR